ncbi:hypothetical protein, partial [Proteus sp. G4463]
LILNGCIKLIQVRDDCSVIVKIDSMQLNNANKFPEFKYIISGQLKMKEISHTGKIIPFCHIKNMKHSVK